MGEWVSVQGLTTHSTQKMEKEWALLLHPGGHTGRTIRNIMQIIINIITMFENTSLPQAKLQRQVT